MSDDLVRRLHREEIERIRGMSDINARESLLSTDITLPEGSPDDPLYVEWNTYRGAVMRLLAAGHRGRFALVKDGQPITVWDSLRDAAQAGRMLHREQACLVQEILPSLRALRVGYNRVEF